MKMHFKWLWIPTFVIVAFLSALFLFYRIGQSDMAPFDEAWYAVVSRNIARNGDVFRLRFADKHFWDHPPVGLYLQAVNVRLFGDAPSSYRGAMAMSGLLTIVFLLVMGIKDNRPIPYLITALVLVTTRWWLIRVRSGNLEAPMLLFQTMAFVLAGRAKRGRDLWIAGLMWGLSMLTKSAISMTMFPVMLLAGLRVEGGVKKWMIYLFSLFLIPFVWYAISYFISGPDYIKFNLFHVGLRDGKVSGLTETNITKVVLYWRSAVNKWYWPINLSIIWGLFNLKKRKYFLVLSYLFISAVPYFTSAESHIWHLSPLYIPVAILVGYMIEDAFKFKKLLGVLAMTVFGYLFVSNALTAWKETVRVVSTYPELRLLRKASLRPFALYTNEVSYMPQWIYYADKKIDTNFHKSEDVFTISRPFDLLTHDYFLPKDNGGEIIDRERDLVLIHFK